MLYQNMTIDELKDIVCKQTKKLRDFKKIGYNLNMARGKPSAEQLNLSMPMLNDFCDIENFTTQQGVDARNYGGLRGIKEARELFANILDVDENMVMVMDNSSLALMYDCISFSYQFGIFGNTPWSSQKIKFLCPVPGYDRHFSICELFGIEMIPIEMDDKGPDMQKVKHIVENDPKVKGIWCVPKYSNPSGITYSDQTVRAFAALSPAAPDFKIYWDNAYVVHHLNDRPDKLLNIFKACLEYGSEDMVIEFASTSKITFPGAGIACIATTQSNLDKIAKIMSYKTICPDKLNQLRHCLFFNSKEKLRRHMQNHAKILKPKFDLVVDYLKREVEPYGIGQFIKPAGGYFISFNSINGCAKEIVSLCKDAGLILTQAGATYPLKYDPTDSNIRIAPTYPSLKELDIAMQIFVTAVKLSGAKKLIKEYNNRGEN